MREEAEAAASELGNTAAVLAKGREQARRLLEAAKPEQKLLPKHKVNHRYSEPTTQRAIYSMLLESCGRCRNFRAPARCTLVEPPVRKVDLCDRFDPKRTPA